MKYKLTVGNKLQENKLNQGKNLRKGKRERKKKRGEKTIIIKNIMQKA